MHQPVAGAPMHREPTNRKIQHQPRPTPSQPSVPGHTCAQVCTNAAVSGVCPRVHAPAPTLAVHEDPAPVGQRVLLEQSLAHARPLHMLEQRQHRARAGAVGGEHAVVKGNHRARPLRRQRNLWRQGAEQANAGPGVFLVQCTYVGADVTIMAAQSTQPHAGGPSRRQQRRPPHAAALLACLSCHAMSCVAQGSGEA